MFIVEIKGKQYEIKEGDTIKVDHIDQEVGTEFDGIKVLYHRKNENDVQVGMPYLENIKVKAKVAGKFKDKKVQVIHYKPKTRIYSKRGHRQNYTHLKIDQIIF